MSKHSFGGRLRRLLHEANIRGISCPVIGIFQPTARRAREIYGRIHGRRAPPYWRKAHSEPLPERAYSTSEAASWLRQEAGIGGCAVANLLETATPRPDSWLVRLMRKDLTVEGIRDGALALCLCEECAEAYLACGGLPLFEKGGRVVQVGGVSLEEAERAVHLVDVVRRRGLRSMPMGKHTVDLPADDDLLALILCVLYGASPGPVAEALRALQTVDAEGGDWLWRVLQERPELRGLANTVQEMRCELLRYFQNVLFRYGR